MTSTRKMWAHVLRSPGHMTFERCPVPAIGDQDVLMRIESVLTCGTDLKCYRRGHPIIPLPMTIGHEYAGTVAAVGRHVRGFAQGDRVATVHSGPCLDCHFCRKGRENLCDSLTRGMVWGGFAEYVRLPFHVHRSNTIRLPAGVGYERSAFLEPVACVLHAIDTLDLSRIETAAVIGAGPMGLIFVQLLVRAGVERVFVVGKRRERLGIARRLGAAATIDVQADDPKEGIRDLTGGLGVDAAVEAVGRTEAWASAVDLVAKGGQVLFYGGCPAGSQLSLDTRRVHYDELTLLGAFHFTRDEVRRAFRLLGEGQVRTEPLVSGRYALPEVPTALGRLMDGDGIKFVIEPHAA